MSGADAAAVTLDGFRACEKALSEPELRQALYDEGADLMAKVLVNLHGEEHRSRRMLEMGVFRRNYFRYYEEAVIPAAFERVMAPILARGEGDVVDIGQRVMLSLSIAFAGVDQQDHSEEEFEALLSILRGLGIGATLGQTKGDREPLRAELRSTLELFESRFYGASLARRQALARQLEAGEIDEDALPRDILMVLARSGDELALSPEVVMKEAAFFFLAGGHTSVHSLGHAVHHLLAWCEAHPEDRPRLESDLRLVQRFVHESFRLHPSSPVAVRRALAPVEFLDGSRAEAGDLVVIDLRSANRDPGIFGAGAERFDPGRELPAGVNETGITFGIGIHACLGRHLAAGTFLKARGTFDPDNHQYGAVARVAHGLLRAGVRADPDRPGELDRTITRETWKTYPVRFAAGGGA